MENWNRNHKLGCADFETLLVRSRYEELAEGELTVLSRHVQSCQKCESYGHALERMVTAMDLSQPTKLTPAPGIRDQVLRRMIAARRTRHGRLSSLLQTGIEVLRFRIPLYQAALGVAFILVLYPFVNQHLVAPKRSDSRQSNVTRTRQHAGEQVSFSSHSDSLDTLRIGRNIKEDSLLLRFIHTSM